MANSVFTNKLLPLLTAAAWREKLGIGGSGTGGPASDVTFDPTGGISSTNVQDALEELDAEKLDDAPLDGQQYGRQSGAWTVVVGGGGGGPVAASDVTVIPSGGISSTDAQAALVELDTEKAPKASPVFTGNPTAPTPTVGDNDTSVATTAFVNTALAGLGVASIIISDTAPPFPAAGAEWWESDSGRHYIWYTDANSSQWVEVGGGQLYSDLVHGPASVTAGNPAVFADTTGKAIVEVSFSAFKVSLALTKADVGLANVDNTSDVNKPVSTAQAAAIALKADLASPTFTGDPKAPTPATADNDTSIATTAFVKAQGYGTGTVTAVTGTAPVVSSGGAAPAISMPAATGLVSGHLTSTDWTTFNNKAPIASPTFTGDPKAPTPTAGDNDTSIATTAFVTAAVTAAAVPPPATVAPLMDGTAAVGTTTKYAREDHRHPTDTSREPTITAGTTAQYWRGDKTFQVLDKAAVGLANVDNTSDLAKPISTAQQTALDLKANLASPVLTGDPRAPTPSVGDNDTSIATTAFVTAAVGAVIAAADAMVFKGVIDCSTNPNYPAADRGHTYRVSVAGKIGGASGVNVEVGDLLLCLTDGTASGTQATVGAQWTIAQANIDGAVTGPASVTSGNPAVFSGSSGKVIAEVTFTAFKTSLALTKSDVGLGNVDNTSDANKPVSTAQQAALDLKAPIASPTFTGDPKAPTPTAGDNDTSIATTAFVTGAIATSDAAQATALALKANLASPIFTGDPQAPTPATADNDTSIATTAFVKAQGYAPLASPVFTGNPTAPTASPGDNDATIATTAFVAAAITAISGGGVVISDTAPASPIAGQLWWESDSGRLFTYYTDANSSAWVEMGRWAS